MTGDGIGRDDLDECWCCNGLHDSLGTLCPDCGEAGCNRFDDKCMSDHKPVLTDGSGKKTDVGQRDKVIVGCKDCGYVTATEFDNYDRDIRGGPLDPGYQHYDRTGHNVGSFEPTAGGELEELWARAYGVDGAANEIDGKRVYKMGTPEEVTPDA